MFVVIFFSFFFSSRRRHTRLNCDWSSDVCSSDLAFGARRTSCRWLQGQRVKSSPQQGRHTEIREDVSKNDGGPGECNQREKSRHSEASYRSEERRVGKECRSLWSQDH